MEKNRIENPNLGLCAIIIVHGRKTGFPMAKSRYELPAMPKLQIPKEKSLAEITEKQSLSVVDYLIILSTMYGIGTAIGIIGGTAQGVIPDRKTKPAVFSLCVALLFLGASRGWVTAKRATEVKRLLATDEGLEAQLQDWIN
jgi:F0F1-type ATP synthase membrane subunit c/vacuolar-type H+-ATPase subunit K